MKTSTLRQIIKEEIAQSSASELLSMLAHPDFKRQLSILNNDSVNSAYENLYATLMGIERNEPLNENTSGVDYISVKIKKEGGFLKQVKGKVKPIKTPQQLNESEENLNISDVRQRFIDLVDDRIKSLEREMNYTKQGQEFYDKLQERIDELTDLLSDMRNVV